ncbi:Nin one binding (NOB1) Zn-ribbon-like [Macleaya cordata]|uniref:Nin one binding (NOB1) Zn-ribbon-like n=1 Tax=Macleaya cordata TaxID=56857 RepID=A0A200RD74_MACCD|nr:Nin one binding (NOB1) Zn-ribbon-like [Macleaya cordata]
MEVTPSTSSSWSTIVKKEAPPKQQEGDYVNRVFVENCKSSNGIAVAVVDANAIIQGGDNLYNSADKFVSVSEVLEEVKDPVSRHKLAFLPFTVETMEPSPEALKKVISFARATGDLQTLSDVDLKLIALTYTLEAQIHGTKHLRDSPPPIHVVNVKGLSEKEMPGWGSNVPNLEEWEALEHVVESGSNSDSRILPLKDLNLNLLPVDGDASSQNGLTENVSEARAEDQEDIGRSLRKPRKFAPIKKEINIEGKKMVADGIDASQGQDDNSSDWLPAVGRSTHRRYLRRKARRELSEASSETNDHPDVETNSESNIHSQKNSESNILEDTQCPDQLLHETSEGTEVLNNISEKHETVEGRTVDGDLIVILKQMRLGADSSEMSSVEACESLVAEAGSGNIAVETDVGKTSNEEFDHLDTSSHTNESVDASFLDDDSSEQSWMLQSLSESSVACITSDFAMQNVILQIGLRLLAPGGMQIRQLHRWILKCHACNKVTAEIGRIFCPKCGNGGTLRRVAVTVGENGIVLAARRPRITLRGTKFSLPLPQGGRDAITKNLILREDQLPHKVLYPKTKKKNKQGDDIFISDDVFSHTPDKRAPLQPPIRKALAVFSGKRNPNDNHFSRSKH